MTNLIKSAAIAALLATASAPAFAAAHMDPNSMTCAEFKALSPEDQGKVALMAIAQVGGEGSTMDPNKPTDGEATATEETGDTTAEEAADDNSESTVAGNNGTATATEGENAENAETMAEEDIEAFNLVCDRNLDATVAEAAAGLEGTR